MPGRLPTLFFSILTSFLVCSSVAASSWAERGGVIRSATNKYSGNWRKLSSTQEGSIEQLIEIVSTSKLGIQLIDKARLRAAKDRKRLEEVIDSGDVSVTDTTLVRKFNPSSPESVRFETRSTVYIDKSHSTKNAVLDLIHELTHYIYKKPFNPYLSEFSVSSFLSDTIQGKGGEVDAFMVECRVGREIYGLKAISPQCLNILDGEEFSRDLAIKEFYKLGVHYDQFKHEASKLGISDEIIQFSSREDSSLISSAWSKPYPVAVIEEYGTIMTKVCQNDLKRMTYLRESQTRSIASANKKVGQVESKFNARCRSYLD
ncbi:hypothetical protein C0Z22_08990 [Halobacteriovorax sp. DA5]|nr:hypothetical protein C0Z22_08990 [Halobacteriovorax sp. DA5]